jgi:hypothetical protein
LLTQIAVGIEPMRYARNISKTSFIEHVELKLDNKYNEKITQILRDSKTNFAHFFALQTDPTAFCHQ